MVVAVPSGDDDRRRRHDADARRTRGLERTPAWYVAVFYATLALATAAVTLRLNLVFTARVHPAMLARITRTCSGGSRGESVQALLSRVGIAVIDGQADHRRRSVSLAIVIVASLAIIEPTTTAELASEPVVGSEHRGRALVPGLLRFSLRPQRPPGVSLSEPAGRMRSVSDSEQHQRPGKLDAQSPAGCSATRAGNA